MKIRVQSIPTGGYVARWVSDRGAEWEASTVNIESVTMGFKSNGEWHTFTVYDTQRFGEHYGPDLLAEWVRRFSEHA